MSDPTRGGVGDVVLWPGKGLYAVAHADRGLMTLLGLEQQPDELGVQAWLVKRVPRPLPEVVTEAARVLKLYRSSSAATSR